MPHLRTTTQALAATAALLAASAGGAAALAAPGDAPRVDEIEAEALPGGRLRLEAETTGRVTSLRFTYRGRTFQGRRAADGDWSRTVRARGGDRDDRVVRVRVRACNGGRCTVRTGSDDA